RASVPATWMPSERATAMVTIQSRPRLSPDSGRSLLAPVQRSPPPIRRRDRAPAAMISTMSDWFRTYGFAQVHDGLLIGAYPLDGDDIRMLGAMSVRQVLNLVEDAEYGPGRRLA